MKRFFVAAMLVFLISGSSWSGVLAAEVVNIESVRPERGSPGQTVVLHGTFSMDPSVPPNMKYAYFENEEGDLAWLLGRASEDNFLWLPSYVVVIIPDIIPPQVGKIVIVSGQAMDKIQFEVIAPQHFVFLPLV